MGGRHFEEEHLEFFRVGLAFNLESLDDVSLLPVRCLYEIFVTER